MGNQLKLLFCIFEIYWRNSVNMGFVGTFLDDAFVMKVGISVSFGSVERRDVDWQ
jgi:hypothetical protein